MRTGLMPSQSIGVVGAPGAGCAAAHLPPPPAKRARTERRDETPRAAAQRGDEDAMEVEVEAAANDATAHNPWSGLSDVY